MYTFLGITVLFLVLLGILCFNFRISTDDYFYIAEVERIGVIKIITSTYLKWSGRFAASAVMNSIFKILHGNARYFFLIPLCTFIFTAAGIYKVISNLLNYLQVGYNVLKKWLLSISFLALLFFMSFDIGETWFWCSSIGCYLFSIVAFIWGLGFILEAHSNILTYLGILICFLFIGGATEIYSPIFLLIFFCQLLYYLNKQGFSLKDSFKNRNLRSAFFELIQNPVQKKLFFAFICLSVGFVILLAAPGNYMRDQLFPSHRFFFSFFVTAKSFVKFIIFYLPLRLHIIIAFSFLFLLLGEEFRTQKAELFQLTFSTFFKRITVLLISLLIVFFYLVAYIMSETGPARIWFLASFLFSVYCCTISFYAGYSGLFSPKQLRAIGFLSLFSAGIILSCSVFNQTIIATHYAARYDEREQQLLKWNQEIKKDSLLHINPLPASGMLYPAEISKDTSHYTNQHLRMIYKLNYHIVKN